MERPAVDSVSNPSSRATHSCVRCSDRKVRCDRQNPCSACVRHNFQCIYRALPIPRRRPAHLQGGSLKEKVKRYEALFTKLGVDPNSPPRTFEVEPRHHPSGSEGIMADDSLQIPTPVSSSSDAGRVIVTSQSSQGEVGPRSVDNSLWSPVIHEFHISEEPHENSSEEASEVSDSDDEDCYVLSIKTRPSEKITHPPTEQITQLWEIFMENIDPLTKIVHVPSLQPSIQKATIDTTRIPKNFEVLMFAIYAAAIMSLNDEECKRRFGEHRTVLLSYYTSATKRALSRAKFMGTVSIVVLQALVLHIFTVRNTYGPRTVWTLTGVAIRIAEGIGLHQDALSLGVPPFQTEIRARIWWQLKGHDFRATELIGLAKFRGFTSDEGSCKPPANVNDNEIYPNMLSPPTSSPELTDICFLMCRFDLASFAKRRGAKFRQQEKDITSADSHSMMEDFITEIEEIMHERYIRRCDSSQPLQLITMLVAQSAVQTVRFLSHHPRRWAGLEQTPTSEQEYVWKVSLALLEQQDIIQSDPRLQGFAWYSAYYLQWHVIIHVLDTLRVKPLMPDIHKAWRLVEATYDNNPDMITDTKKTIHVAVGNLCLNAYSAYEAAIGEKRMATFLEPDYITKLRQQREAAKARRLDSRTKSKGVRTRSSNFSSSFVEVSTEPEISAVRSNLDTQDCQPNTFSESANFIQTNETEPFWLTSGLDDGLYCTSGDIMNMDMEFLLSQDYLNGSTDQGIDWAQWDAWLGEQSVVHAPYTMDSTKLM